MRKRLFSCAAALLLAMAFLCGCGAVGTERLSDSTTREISAAADLEVYCFSAGKADAFLLMTENGTVLIDAGEKGFGKTILAELERRGIERLDCLIVTHFDQDHVGGAAKVLNNIPVDQVLQSNSPKDSEEYEKYLAALETAGITPVTVRETFSFTLDGVAYTVDPPRRETYAEDESNNSSLIVSVQNGGDLLLFAGDAEDARIAEFVSGNGSDYDFLKLPHHGAWQETLEELLSSTTPEYAVITSSDKQQEDERTLALLEREGVSVYLTRTAPVILESGGDGLRLRYAA